MRFLSLRLRSRLLAVATGAALAVGGASSWPVPMAASTQIVTLPNPMHLSATYGGYNTGIRVAWSDSSGAKYYSLFRAQSADFSQAVLRAQPRVLRFNDRTTLSGVVYYYWVQAADSGGRVSDIVGPTRGLRGLAPRFTQEPQDLLADAGTDQELTATVQGVPAVKYQWYKGSVKMSNSRTVSGVHTATLRFHPLEPNDAAYYRLHIYNVTGGVESRPAQVQVIRAPTPPA